MSALDSIKTPPKVRRVPASKAIPVNAKCKVAKNLFGPVDHVELENDLDLELKRINDEKKDKWGFDFSEGKPVEGSSIEWIEIPGEIVQKETQPENSAQKKEPVEPIKFNTAAFSGVAGFKLLPNAKAPVETVSASPDYIQSVLNPIAIRKAAEITPTNSEQKKRSRLLNRTSSKVKCKPRKLTSSPGFSEDKTQPSIQSFFKKRKHVPELSTVKKAADSPVSKRPRLSDAKTVVR
eukprot:sb/3469233/